MKRFMQASMRGMDSSNRMVRSYLNTSAGTHRPKPYSLADVYPKKVREITGTLCLEGSRD